MSSYDKEFYMTFLTYLTGFVGVVYVLTKIACYLVAPLFGG